MAGIVGLVSTGQRGNLELALSRLCILPSFRRRTYVDSNRLLLGAVHRPGAAPDVHVSETISVITYGLPLLDGTRIAGAPELAEKVLDRGVDSLTTSLEGSFVVAVVWDKEERVWVINDRTGSIPVVWTDAPGKLAFAPAAKALFALLGSKPVLDQDAILSFVNCGHPVGARTMFEGVRVLEPGHVLAVNLRDAVASCDRYWDLRFAPTRLSARAATRELGDALRQGYRSALADDPERIELLLTGGYDSRTVLGIAAALGRPPGEAVTWGAVSDVAGSDPAIARQIATDLGVRFRFLHYDADGFLEHAVAWTIISELTSDNAGNFPVAADFLCGDPPQSSVVLIGDQMLGPGGFPLDLRDAVSSITRVPPSGLVPAFAGVLRERIDLGARFLAQVDRIVQASPSDDPKDVQDYLFFHLYVFRWLHAPAYFREPMVAVRRPIMAAPVIELTQRLPRWLRVDKGILLRFLRTTMPRLYRYPKASAHSLIDWDWGMRRPGGLRELMLELLSWDAITRTPLDPLLDRPAWERFVANWFSVPPAKLRRRASLLPRIVALRGRVSLSPTLGRMARRVEPIVKRVVPREQERGDSQVIRRVALVSLLTRCIDEGQLG